MKLAKGGNVRIKPKEWEKLTELAVDATLKLAVPVNQSAVLHFLIDLYIDDIDAKMLKDAAIQHERKLQSA